MGFSWRLQKSPLVQVAFRSGFLLATWGVGNNKPFPKGTRSTVSPAPHPHALHAEAPTCR